MARYHDAFMMDLENSGLENWTKAIPTGNQRHKDPDWAAHIKPIMDFSDTTWLDYCRWVEGGGGDEWFLCSSSTGTSCASS
jgi:hypothetical protein